MNRKLYDLRDVRNSILKDADKILDRSKNEKRAMTDSERAECDKLLERIEGVNKEIDALESDERRAAIVADEKDKGSRSTGRKVPAEEPRTIIDGRLTYLNQVNQPNGLWQSANGRSLHTLTREQRWADLPWKCDADPKEYSLGKAIVGLATGQWDAARDEHRALSTTVGGSGGILVPGYVASNVVDYARAASIGGTLGVTTLRMQGATETLARVSADPTFSTKSENVAFSESEPTFDGVELVARTIGCITHVSRELLMDAPNAAQAIEQSLARGLAAEIDRLVFAGDGDGEPVGLCYHPTISHTGSSGEPDWDKVLTALSTLEAANCTPNGFVTTTAVSTDLRKVKASTAGMYMGPPAPLDKLAWLTSNQMPSGYLLMGNFASAILALREDVTVEVSTDTKFAEHQVAIKVYWRGDVGCARPGDFVRLAGLT